MRFFRIFFILVICGVLILLFPGLFGSGKKRQLSRQEKFFRVLLILVIVAAIIRYM